MRTKRRLEVIDVTRQVRSLVAQSGVREGIVNVWLGHTTAGVTVNEADPDLWEDLLETLSRLVPLDAHYRHNAKYAGFSREQNAHAHIISMVMQPEVTIPVSKGDLMLGTWQSVLLVELDGPRTRRVVVTVVGD
ncbi:MAG TPA: YjbQ family protein [Candidatus Korarchaeota archaeon]|nr:YjbQ family protein [Candidatus Korarchaeota archaeon]